MTQLTKADLARMEAEDKRYSSGERGRKNTKGTPKPQTKSSKNINLKSFRGASPQALLAEFDDFDDDNELD